MHNLYFLSSTFEQPYDIEQSGHIYACGFAYHRIMSQGPKSFIAGIVGSIAVSKAHRGKGLAKAIIKTIDEHSLYVGIDYSFLFAYNINVYLSSRYQKLSTPIRYFDSQQQRWKQFIYRGGMFKSYTPAILPIQFNGVV